MKMSAKLIGASELKRTLDKFSQLTGKGVERGIDEMALSSARALAMKVQPYGLTSAKGAKFQKNIEAQVTAAWFMVNTGIIPATNSMEQAHKSARRQGRVRIPKGGFKRSMWKTWRDLISEPDRDAYIQQQIRKAGRAKASWITAGESLGVGKISGVAQWIRRHVGSYSGTTRMGKMLRAKVELANKTPYISNLQKSSEIKSALATGRKNGLKRMKIIIAAELKKIK
jgi:hypothetical protein